MIYSKTKIKNKTAFVAHFSPFSKVYELANSVAGHQVQRQIFKELLIQSIDQNSICYAMPPNASWPNGPFVCRSSTEDSVEFIGYLNLPLVKHIFFAFRLMLRLFKTRPQLCLQYNSYLFENLAILIFRLCHRGSSAAIIIQDIHITRKVSLFSKIGIRSFSERLSLKLAKNFDIIVPVTLKIITDFHFDKSKCFIFQGGVTEFATQLMHEQSEKLEEIGVFAGALEPHNGIELLVNQWLAKNVKQSLHIFGRGSLENYIYNISCQSERIIFHGFQIENEILKWQRKARWNFCLRYSSGINQEYFFPSKLFNILCAPGSVIVNNFHGIPDSIRHHLCFVTDDLSNLEECLIKTIEIPKKNILFNRRQEVSTKHSWNSCIKKILLKLN